MFKILALLLVVKLYATDLNSQNTEANQLSQQQQQEIETEGKKGKQIGHHNRVIAKLTAYWVLQPKIYLFMNFNQFLIFFNLIFQFMNFLKSEVNQRIYLLQNLDNYVGRLLLEGASEEELNNVMKSIQEDKKNYKSFKQQIPDFSFDVFNSTSFDWTVTKNDETLMKYIRAQYIYKIYQRFEERVNQKNAVNNQQHQRYSIAKQAIKCFAELKKKISEMSKKSQFKNSELTIKINWIYINFISLKQQE
ncbi:unnamed protein product [Paramecium octaurelia]|uniref:Transmembrane protein n=1 Tax=Paramecium octaurelia TaxID=43137 RepID=A0A8S1Y7Y3_PAROT|nr:unnamed protein product [Paramecium octaurelia]